MMHISIEHIDGKYPSFNVSLHSKEGDDPFLVVKGCRIADGKNGPFVSGPATKNQTTGKYWNHTYFGDKFSAVVLSKAQEAMRPKSRAGGTSRQSQDDDSSIPF